MPRLIRFRRSLIAGTALAVLASPAVAQSNAELQQELRALRDELRAVRGELDALKTQTGAQFTETVRRQNEQTKVTLGNGKPTFESADGNFTASIRGRAQLDYGYYDQAPAGPLATDYRRGSAGDATEAARARDLSDGFNFRRAQIGIEGTFFKDFGYSLAYQFGGSGAEEGGRVQDVYLDYRGIKNWRLRAGAFSPPANLDDAVGAADTLFLERASSAEIARALAAGEGRAGIGMLGSGERWTASLVLTGGTIGTTSFDEQAALVGRATFLAFNDPALQLHVGANATWVFRTPDNGPDASAASARRPVRLRDRPENRVDGTRLIDTGDIDAESVLVPGVEIAMRYKALLIQAEHFWYAVERRQPSALPDPDFTGWYVQASYTLTGEPRRYNAQNGAFGAPQPAAFVGGKGDAAGAGAFEVAARYSEIDLDFDAGGPGSALPAGGIRGGRQRTFTAGLNWYLNQTVRFAFDYQRVDVDRLSPGGTAFGAGALTPPAGAQIGQEFDIFSIRSQISF